MRLIIDIPDKAYENIKGGLWCGDNITSNAIENGTPIPDNATNGDVIKAMFPDLEYKEGVRFAIIVTPVDAIGIWNSWWNAPYQKGGKE